MLPFRSLGTAGEQGNYGDVAFKDATCLIWAVLALARLNEKVLPFTEAFAVWQSRGAPWEYRLRNALDDAIQSFCDVHIKNTWSTLYAESAYQIMINLRQTAIDYLDHTENGIETDQEIAHLVQIFHHFYRRITLGHPNHLEPFGVMGMLAAVLVRMNMITANDVSETLTTYMMLAAIQAPTDQIENYLEERLNVICAKIERFVREQKDLEALSNYDPEGRTGDNFVQMIRDPLRQHVGCLLEELLLNIFPSRDGAIDWDVHFETRLVEFYAGIAKFFSYASPLLSYYFIPDIVDDEEYDDEYDDRAIVPEHVANHDFSNYEEDDWFSHEYILFEVQDILHGPEHVELDDVSILAATSIDCSCFICGDDDTEMRKLKVCGHEICATCLESQLQAEHECRYRCAFCRSEFFPQEEAGVQPT